MENFIMENIMDMESNIIKMEKKKLMDFLNITD